MLIWKALYGFQVGTVNPQLKAKLICRVRSPNAPIQARSPNAPIQATKKSFINSQKAGNIGHQPETHIEPSGIAAQFFCLTVSHFSDSFYKFI